MDAMQRPCIPKADFNGDPRRPDEWSAVKHWQLRIITSLENDLSFVKGQYVAMGLHNGLPIYRLDSEVEAYINYASESGLEAQCV